MLLFVYNADSGKLNALLDTAHKIVSPSTYSCRLCELTYGLMNEKQAWREFHQSLGERVVFLHRDEFEAQYQQRPGYPFLADVGETHFEVLLDSVAFAKLNDTTSLIAKVQQVIAER